VTKTSKENTTC